MVSIRKVEDRFHGNFLYPKDYESGKVDPEDYRHYFEAYSPQKWDFETNGGYVQYISPDGRFRNSIVMNESPEYGISIVWYQSDRVGSLNDELVTVGDSSKIRQAIGVGIDELVSLGTFISPKDAWEIVSDFFNSPLERPKSDKMCARKDLAWPDWFDFEVIPYRCER